MEMQFRLTPRAYLFLALLTSAQILLVFYCLAGVRASSHSPMLIHSSFFNYVSSEKVAFQAIGFSKCRDQGSVFVQVNGEMFPGTFDVLRDKCPSKFSPYCTWNAYRIYVEMPLKQIPLSLLQVTKEGLVTIVNWPDLPKSEGSNPNLGVYRLGLDSSHLDCVLRSKKKFVAQVDFDDYMFVRGKTLLDYVTEHEKTHPEVGSFSFVRGTLLKQPVHGSLQDISSVSFEEFRKASVCDECDYNKKVIVVADKVDIILTHRVKTFRKNEVMRFGTFEIPMEVGVCYHARYALSPSQQKANYQKVNLFSSRVIASLTEKFIEIAGELANTTAKLDISPTVDLLEECTQNWRLSPSQCKAPHEYCWSKLITVDRWKFANDRVGSNKQYVTL
uniref:Glycosyltransferase family 92 protein n=1 Tax=Steinernema glaseri TaxID=37863 RepID=A0A1I7YNP0_9BILA